MKHHCNAAALRPINWGILSFLENIKALTARDRTECAKPSLVVFAWQLHQYREKLLTHAGPRSR
jgi:hypothetical protein